MKIHKIVLAACMCGAFYSSGFAQGNTGKGYVITTANDTVKCEIKGGLFTDMKYRPVNATEFSKIKADNIKEYFDGETHYVAVLKPGATQPEYLALRQKGKLTVYEDAANDTGGKPIIGGNIGIGGSPVTTLYISKDNSPVISLQPVAKQHNALRLKRKKIFMAVIADDAPLAEKFNAEDTYNYTTLQKYVSEYNADMAGK
jgi:hypothetical protein